jgi:ankyrin repeat protein
LHVASDKGLAGTVAKLLSHGADAALADEHGKTALDYAKADEVKAALREHGGKHSLFYAVSEGMPELFATLIEESADVHARDNGGKTPLDYAKTEEVKAVFAKHSLLAAIRFDRDEQVAEHIAAGADLKARDSLGWTVLLFACAHGHEAAAALLAEPSQAAGVLDAVGDDGFSALLWAEERGLDRVSSKLRECGALAVRSPALALFCGENGAVQIKVAERTVAFAHSFVTVRSALRCPLGGKGYYELEIMELDKVPQYGFAAPAFARVLEASGKGVGDDEHSWAVDGGTRQRKCHVSIDARAKTNTASLLETFAGLDLDGDGLLSLEEFTPLANMWGAEDDTAIVQAVLAQLDSDGNGAISENEFLGFFRQALQTDDLDGLADEMQEGMQEMIGRLRTLKKDPYKCTWQVGDIIGLACDLNTMQMYVSVNGNFTVPNGVVFALDPDAVGEGLFAALSGISGKVRYNLGEAPFKHAPPAADYQAFAAFENRPNT